MSLTERTLREQAFLLLAAARTEEEAKAIRAAWQAAVNGKPETLKQMITLEVKK